MLIDLQTIKLAYKSWFIDVIVKNMFTYPRVYRKFVLLFRELVFSIRYTPKGGDIYIAPAELSSTCPTSIDAVHG